jgi:nitroreductase
MTLYEAIFKRQSVRKYTNYRIDDKIRVEILEYFKKITQLDDSINTKIEIVFDSDFSDMAGGYLVAKAPQYLVITSEKKGDYLQNAGFIGEQLMLYLTTKGFGTCWLGGASAKSKTNFELPYIITIAFGIAENGFREDITNIKRKNLNEIAKGEIKSEAMKEIMETIRIAPSAMNLQPWRLVVEGDYIHIFKAQPNIIIRNFVTKVQYIDIGIATAHIFIAIENQGKKPILERVNGAFFDKKIKYEYSVRIS